MSGGSALPLSPGDLVAGRFEVDHVLGRGGMGVVFSAVDAERGALVAIKCLLPELCENADLVTRFVREGQATTRLHSEHVARVFEIGTLASGIPFLVMEQLEGADLRSYVRAYGPLSPRDAAIYVAQACEALAEAHALGIIHRDLKPANLFLGRPAGDLDGPPFVKVLDFGIAKFTSPNLTADQAEMTRTEALLGSRAYMSPEQMRSPRDVDARADIWSLGVILYFLVTGQSPFTAETAEGTIARVLQDQPAPLSSFVSGVAPAFEAIVLRCLAKARDARFANVTDLARALAPFAEGSLARPTMPLTVPPPAPSGPTMRGVALSRSSSELTTRSRSNGGDPEAAVRRPRRGPQMMVLASLLSVLLAGAVVVDKLRPARGDERRDAVAAAAEMKPSTTLTISATSSAQASPSIAASASESAVPPSIDPPSVAPPSAPRPLAAAKAPAAKPVRPPKSATVQPDTPW